MGKLFFNRLFTLIILAIFTSHSTAGTTEIVDNIGSIANQSNIQMSDDSRYIVFSTTQNLVASDPYNQSDIYIRDRQINSTELVSISNNSTITSPRGWSFWPSISANGRYVAFFSNSRDLLTATHPSPPLGYPYHIYVRDLITGTIEIVSVSSSGTLASPDYSFEIPSGPLQPLLSISKDGRYIIFSTNATNLVANDTNNSSDIFLHDRQTKNTELVSIINGSAQPGGGSILGFNNAASSDGRYIVFTSSANTLVTGDNNISDDIFVRDRLSSSTQRISIASSGTESNAMSRYPAISHDGRFIVFESLASNLVIGDSNGVMDIFVHDRQTRTTERVSIASDGSEANQWSYRPDISGDGRYVMFTSDASNLVTGDSNNTSDIFVHDRQTGVTERVNVANDGSQGNGWSISHQLSSDSRFVAFSSSADNLVPNDFSNFIDFFIHHREIVTPPTKPTVNATVIPTEILHTAGTINITINGNLTNVTSVSFNKPGITLPCTISSQNTTSIQCSLTLPPNQLGKYALQLQVSGTDADVTANPLKVHGLPDIAVSESILCRGLNTAGDAIVLRSFANYVNNGANASNTSITMTLSPIARLSTVFDGGSETAPGSNVVQWNIGSVPALEQGRAGLEWELPLNRPPGTLFSIDVSINAAIADTDLSNNTSNFSIFNSQVSCDPNEIYVSPAGAIKSNQVLSYSIAFENLGTAPAHTVTITDALPATLDATSLIHISNGGTYDADTHTITWVLEGINLPPNETDYVSFRIKPFAGTPPGTQISNQATIVFDENPPIITEPVLNWIASPPVANAGPDQTLECNAAFTPITLDGSASQDVNNDPLSFLWSGSFGTLSGEYAEISLPVGQHPVTLSVSDGLYEPVTDEVLITIQDTTPPTIDAGTNVTLEATTMEGANYTIMPMVDDLCSEVSLSQSPSLFYYPLGTTSVTVTATDDSGNSSSDQISITVQDTIAPELIPPADITVEASGLLTLVDIGQAEASDIFPVSVSNNAPAAGFPFGVTEVIWQATDANGNSSQATQRVTVQDSTPPVIDAALNPIGEIDDDEGRFQVQFSCSDNLGQVESLSATLNGIEVKNGQRITLELDDEQEAEYRRGRLKELEAPAFSLQVQCSDEAGNQSSTTVQAEFPLEQDDDEDDDDAEGESEDNEDDD